MTFSPREFTFSVDLPGLIELMGTALYSEPEVAVRELIQNAHDGIIRRRLKDLNYQGRIHFRQDAATGTLYIEDDGIGLNVTDAEKYLGTLGAGITGLMRREARQCAHGSEMGLIGQFGIGLLSAFLLSDNIEVESLKADGKSDPICWKADSSTVIRLSPGTKTTPGTTVILHLRPERIEFAQSEEVLEEAVRRYADFLNVPIFIGDHDQRANLMNPVWFDAEADEDQLIMALESRFHELPLCVIPIRREKPVRIQGALYVSPQRLPGFSAESMVAVTVHRMIISHQIQRLIPPWASFVRGVLELPDCHPTASREELVRDDIFELVKTTIEEELYSFFESLVQNRPAIWESLLSWHRYMLAGSAIDQVRLRQMLRSTYQFSTHLGRMTFDEIVNASREDFDDESDTGRRSTSRDTDKEQSEFAESLGSTWQEPEERPEKVIWYHGDRRQEAAMSGVFAGLRFPCVHATMTFEESLLYAITADYMAETGKYVDCRVAVPGARGFSTGILGAKNQSPLDEQWDFFFESLDCRVYSAECHSRQPVFAFLNERQDLIRTIDSLKKSGTIPYSFQRMIDRHLEGEELPRNELLLNRSHPLVAKVLRQSPNSPLAAVLRVLVYQTMQTAGAQLNRTCCEELDGDLLAIAASLGGDS